MNEDENNNYIVSILEDSMGLPPEKLPDAFHSVGWALPRWHLLMLQDRPRMEFYSEILRHKVEGKIVLDVGTGSGILSHLALKWGAKKVYSVEQNTALQTVYRHLMREPLKEGRAQLFCQDARDLKLAQFKEGPVDVIVHELFGSIGLGENLIPIFQILGEEGILTRKTELLPDGLEVWMRPVFSELVAREGRVEAFGDYPLDELNIFGCHSFWEQDYIASRASDWKTTGSAQLLFKCNLKDLVLPEKVVLSFEASKCSQLKLWLKITDTKSGLTHTNDHQEVETHWTNAYLSVPYWLQGKNFKAEFQIHQDYIQVNRFF
ncbi:MAG TPA: 50S ribosomal protein L11 methyltransferase [Bacteriovoracaceae bacterium]|nr:50S ribosomal protein L11 methyltransferase [Bacteriovoracaceae bacterium]